LPGLPDLPIFTGIVDIPCEYRTVGRREEVTMKKPMLIAMAGVFLAGMTVLYLATRQKTNTNIIGKPDVVIHVDENDREMQEAIELAKRTFPRFVDNWKSTKNQGYSLKFAVRTAKGGVEHIWFNPVTIDGDLIQAVCASDPEDVPGLKDGDRRELKKADISDWMIMLNGKCYGGYTIRVLAKRDPSQKPPFEFADF
jgi:uncharacterized protein YegJ (DUF2314 family)